MGSNLVTIATEQVLVLFLLMFVGFIVTKLKGVGKDARVAFSDMLVNVIMPAMIINSYLSGYDPAVSANLLKTLIFSVIAMLVSIGISCLVCVRIKDAQAPIMRFAGAFSNAGYMGFPLITALFGSEGLLYASIFHTVFNILVWTVGVRLIERDHSGTGLLPVLKDLAKKPPLIAVAVGLVIYFGQITLPDLIVQPIELIGNMNTPMAMFITGMLLAGGGFGRILRDRRLWVVIMTKLILIPAVVFAICFLTGATGMVGAVVVLLTACPTASNVSVFTVRYQYDEALGAGTVVVSTLLSILTLPLFAGLISYFM